MSFKVWAGGNEKDEKAKRKKSIVLSNRSGAANEHRHHGFFPAHPTDSWIAFLAAAKTPPNHSSVIRIGPWMCLSANRRKHSWLPLVGL